MPDEPSQTLIYQNVPFERRWMRFERSMWLLLTLVLIAASFGVFGRGAYARKTQQEGALTVEYDSIVRSRNQNDMVVTVDSSAGSSGQVRLLLTGAFLDKARLYDVVPNPLAEEILQNGVALTFKTVPGKPGTVTFIQKVQGIGRVQSHIGLDTASPMMVNQIILP